MKEDTHSETLLNQQSALGAYFDDLLADRAVSPPQAVDTNPASNPEPAPAPPVDGAPAWAATCFQVQLFEVAGVTLAVPLEKLEGVVPEAQGLTDIAADGSLLLGVTAYRDGQSKVIDTARLILPADRAAQLNDDSSGRASGLLVIDGGRWALACSKLGDVIDLEAAQVKWRTSAGKRLWLAGTVAAHRCALLDIDELSSQLAGSVA